MEKGKEAGRRVQRCECDTRAAYNTKEPNPTKDRCHCFSPPSYSPSLPHTFARLPSHLYSLRLPCWLGVLQSLAEAELEADLSQRRKRGKAAARRIYSTSSKKSEADEQQRASFVRSLLRNPI